MAEATLTKKDLKSDQEVRWCPGCGDYAILNCVQGALATLGIPKENLCMVSGIGCSSRFPYYMNTYGFHSIHGRAPAVATGVKLANPELSVWLVTGDGDGLSIGGNHMIHALRRNVGLKILLFNNEIYGLTKGQYSPTSPVGQRSKSTPLGSIDNPFNTINIALGAGATFIARTIDTHQKHMDGIIKAAAAHEGTAFVEIMQNCVIFNPDFYNSFAEKKVRDDQTIDLVPGEKMIYGKERDKGLRFEGMEIQHCSADEASVWDPTTRSSAQATLIAEMNEDPSMPRPVGILRQVAKPVFEDSVYAQVRDAEAKKGKGSLKDLVYAGDMWEVE